MRSPNFRFAPVVSVMRTAGVDAAFMAAIVVGLVCLGLVVFLIRSAVRTEAPERQSDDTMKQLGRLLWENQRFWLAFILAGAVFPVFVFIFQAALDMTVYLLTLPFDGLEQGPTRVISMIDLGIAVIFSVIACRYVWTRAGKAKLEKGLDNTQHRYPDSTFPGLRGTPNEQSRTH